MAFHKFSSAKRERIINRAAAKAADLITMRGKTAPKVDLTRISDRTLQTAFSRQNLPAGLRFRLRNEILARDSGKRRKKR